MQQGTFSRRQINELFARAAFGGALGLVFAAQADAAQQRRPRMLDDPILSLMPLSRVKAHVVFVPHADPSKIRILDEDDADVLIHPASLTKEHSFAVNAEAIDNGYIDEDAPIEMTTSSKRAASAYGRYPQNLTGLTGKVPLNKVTTIYMVASKNDAPEAAGEAISRLDAYQDLVRGKGLEPGTGRGYAAIMNDFAARHDMLHTRFSYSNGLAPRLTNRPYDPPNVTTARDLTILTNHLLTKQLARIKEHCTPTKYNMPDKARTMINSTNPLLEDAIKFNKKTGRFVPRAHSDHLAGTFGLKTGFIAESAYNIIVVAEQDIGGGEMATIGIVELGSPSPEARIKDVHTHAKMGFDILRAERKHRLENPVQARANGNYTEYATYEKPVYLDPDLDSEPLIMTPSEYARAVPRLALKR